MRQEDSFISSGSLLSHAFNREIAGTAGQNDTRRFFIGAYVVPAIEILWDTLGHAGTGSLRDFESLDGDSEYGIIRSEFSFFSGSFGALPVTEKKEIRIPHEVAISILIAAFGLASWMTKIAFDTGSIKGDVSKAVEQNASIIADHENRLRDLEREKR